MLGRRQIVMGAAAAVGSAMNSPLAAAPFEWLRTSPSDAGFTSDLEARLPVVTVEMSTAATGTTPSGRRVAAP
jgi:H+/Cl- antiporter ClcA